MCPFSQIAKKIKNHSTLMCLEENPATPLMKFRTFRTHCSSIPMFGVVILIFITLCACLSVYTIRTPGNGRPLVSWSTPLTGQWPAPSASQVIILDIFDIVI